MSHYPHLFSSLTINGMMLRNRIIMPPTGTNVTTLNGGVSREQLEYYELRVKGSTGLTTIEDICIDFPLASNDTTQLRTNNDQYIPRLFKSTETLYKHSARVPIQLNRADASAYAYCPDGQTSFSSSATPSEKHGNIPRPMAHEETYHAVEKFGNAAEHVRRTGFDSVEIHAGYSYLINQFLSPLFNKRTDEFGGSVENHTRILSLIIDKVRTYVGPRFPASLCINADDFLRGDSTFEDSLHILELCQDKVGIIGVPAMQNDNLNLQIDQTSLEDDWKHYFSHVVRGKFHKPTVITGNIRSLQMVKDTLASGDAGLIAISRGLIVEPEWVRKVQGGKEHLMREYISCNIGYADHRIVRLHPLRCSTNPDIIHGDAYKMCHVSRETNVVVIGAGIAGMGAACTAAGVGCHTQLLGAKNHVGGLASDISRLLEKKCITGFSQFMRSRIAPLGNLILQIGKRADVASVSALHPHLIVNATGSMSLLLPIEGLRENIDTADGKVFSIIGMIDNLAKFTSIEGKCIAVIGAGAVGLDVIKRFMARGVQAVLIEMQDAIGRGLDIITKNVILAMLDEYQVEQHMSIQLMAVAADHFRVKNTQQTSDIPLSYGFAHLGMYANRMSLDETERQADADNVKIMNVGDGLMARHIIDDIREGRNVLDTLEDMGALGSREAQRIPFLTY